MRIVMIGQRGVPATYGGIERHVEELGARLVQRGHEVVVYCRRTYGPTTVEYRGMALRTLPTIHEKHLEATAHSAAGALASLTEGADIVHFHALGPGLFSPLPRWLSRAGVVQTVHGLDHQRAKWGAGAQKALAVAQWLSTRVPDAVIGVSAAIADHYRRAASQRGPMVVHIPNGVDRPQAVSSDVTATIMDDLGVDPGNYVLFVGRLVPEKAPADLVRAFRRVSGPDELVVVGGSSHTDDYVAHLHDIGRHDRRVRFTGYLYGDTLNALYRHAAAFVLPSRLEGLPLTLLEACSHGIPVVASDIEPHAEVLVEDRPGGRLFRTGDEADLTSVLARSLADPVTERAGARRLHDEVLRRYDWDAACEATEDVYNTVRRGDASDRATLADDPDLLYRRALDRRPTPARPTGRHRPAGVRPGSIPVAG